MKIILLTQGFETQVSDEDFDFLNQWLWHYLKKYAARRDPNQQIDSNYTTMHFVIGGRIGLIGLIDHKDRNRLNNQRDNLRVASNSQNGANAAIRSDNTSGYKGVTWNKNGQKWQAQIRFQGTHSYLGLFDSPIEAAKAYNRAAVRLFGEFAVLNEVD